MSAVNDVRTTRNSSDPSQRLRVARSMRSEEGAAAVEFAMVAVVLFMLVFGIIEFGFAFSSWSATGNGAREGARAGAVKPDVAAIEARVRGAASSLNQSRLTVTITCAAAGGSSFGSCPASSAWAEGDLVRVSVRYVYPYITPLPSFVGLGPDLNVRSVSESRFEG